MVDNVKESNVEFWTYPQDRYYYNWYGSLPPSKLTDGDIKSMVVEQLRVDPFTADETIRVDVKRNVVILTGDVSTTLAKRVAGDDAWDTPGVADVSNQLAVDPAA